MTDINLVAELAETVRGIARIAPEVPIGPGSLLVEDLGIDSLELVNIVLTTEEKYGVAIDEDEVATIRTIADLVGYVHRMQGVQAA